MIEAIGFGTMTLGEVVGTVEVCGAMVRETEQAVLINDGNREAWIPKSQILQFEQDFKAGLITVIIPEWLAIEKELA